MEKAEIFILFSYKREFIDYTLVFLFNSLWFFWLAHYFEVLERFIGYCFETYQVFSCLHL